VRTARAKSPMLMTIDAIVSTLGHIRVKPSVYFRPTAHPISNMAATNRYVQPIAWYVPMYSRPTRPDPDEPPAGALCISPFAPSRAPAAKLDQYTGVCREVGLQRSCTG